MSVIRTLVHSSRALVTTAKDVARTREIAGVFWKHGFGWVIRRLKLRKDLQIDEESSGSVGRPAPLEDPDTGERLVAALTDLGPTWVKFGQIMSTRPDVLPAALIERLASLQDQVAPMAESDMTTQMSAQFGPQWRERFSEFDTTPMASASIGQVHAARLKTGEQVVLKIQRLDIQPKITSDLHILHVIATWMEDAFEAAHAMDLTGMVRDFAKSLEQELDYRAEASNIEMFRQNFREIPNIHLPEVYRDLSTRYVLCMEHIEGRKMTELLDAGDDTHDLVTLYFNMAYQMLFVDGFFHGDLHPGNVLIQNDGSLAVIDCGMVGRLAPSRKDRIVDIIWAVLNEDLEAVARHIYDLAIPSGVVDYPSFEADAIAIAERYIVGVPLSHIQMGALFADLVQGATRHQVRMPTDFTMMFKAIMTTEGLAKAIAPDINPIDLAYPYVSRMVTERYSPERVKQVLLSDLQQVSSMLRGMPRALPRTLDNLNRGALTFGINDATLATIEQAQSRRTGRTIRAAFTMTTLVCGAMTLGVEQLPAVLWGINGVSLAFWFLSATGATSLLRRGGLL